MYRIVYLNLDIKRRPSGSNCSNNCKEITKIKVINCKNNRQQYLHALTIDRYCCFKPKLVVRLHKKWKKFLAFFYFPSQNLHFQIVPFLKNMPS